MKHDQAEPIFSVIITCYNKASCIERAVNSAKCAAPKTEVIVVDDCSTDESRQIILSLEIDQKIFHPTNRGALQANLSGMRAARGTYLVMLDGDDVLAPFVFHALLPHLDSDSCARLGMGALSKRKYYHSVMGNLKVAFTFRPARWFAISQNTGGSAYVFSKAIFEECDAILGGIWPDITVQDHILPGIMALRTKRFVKFATPSYFVDESNPTSRLSRRVARCNHDRLISDYTIWTAASSTMRQPLFARILLKLSLIRRMLKYTKIYKVSIPNVLALLSSPATCQQAFDTLTAEILRRSAQG